LQDRGPPLPTQVIREHPAVRSVVES